MSYVAIDDHFPEHQKVDGLHDRAFRFHVTALCYCGRNLTDGHISAKAVKVVAAIMGTQPRRWANELVAARLWKRDEAGDGFWIHDYLKYNPSAEEVKVRKERAKKGAAARWGNPSSDASSDASSIAGNVYALAMPSPPLPSPRALAQPPTPSSYEAGEDAHASGEMLDRIHRACGGSSDAGEKLRRTVAKRNPSYETMVRALDAAKAPCRDPLAVALAILAPKGAA